MFLDRAGVAALRPALIDTWNAASDGQLPLDTPLWTQNAEDEKLYHDGDCIVVQEDGVVAGFALTRLFSADELAANPDMSGERGVGHILALAVHPDRRRQGIGSALLQAAEDHLREQGATVAVLIGSPGHLVPGPPADTLDNGFWQRRGYEDNGIVVDLRRSLDDWVTPAPPEAVANGDYAYRQGRPGEEDAIIEFLSRAFPGGWRYSVARFFAHGYQPGDITLTVDSDDKIQGFLCTYHGGSNYIGAPTHWYPMMREGVWGGMGPLGMAADLRRSGRGLGLGMVGAGADYLYSIGVRDCAIDWTTLIDFYGKHGFEVWKRYLQLKPKMLT